MTWALAEELKIEEQSLRQQISRSRREVSEKLATELGIVLPRGYIENKRSDGYRLSPELREVSLWDLQAAGMPTSHNCRAKCHRGREDPLI